MCSERSGWTCIATSARSRSREAARSRSAGRIATTPAALELFAASLAPTDRVALGGHRQRGGDRADHRAARRRACRRQPARHRRSAGRARRPTGSTRARWRRLLAAGELDAVWMPDERTRAMRRRLARRSQLVRARTRAKNEIHAVLIRRLKGRPPVSDLFGVKGRALAGRARAARRRARDRRRAACATSTSSTPRSPRSIARSRARRCTARHAAADDRARRQRDHRQHVHRRDRRHPPLPQRAAAGRLPRPGSQGPPVRLDAGPPRTHHQARLRRRPPRARRSRLGRGPRSPARCARSTSASAPAAAPRSRPSPPRASSPACSGACSSASRTTPSASPR